MSRKNDKKETINRVMHLLRSGRITTATPNREVWKHFTFEENNGWISVDDELPPKRESEEISEYYLVSNGSWLDICRYDYRDKSWSDYRYESHWGVTHWMPLPSQPKKGGKR